LLVAACDDIPEPDPVDPLFGTNRFDSREHETALGDMICDGLVWGINEGSFKGQAAPVDFAVLNGGIFEYGLEKGAITAGMIPGMIKGDILSIIPLSGADVTELFTWLAALRLGENAWAQVSAEVRYTIDWTNGMGKLRDLEIKGLPVDDGAVYRIATGDVLVHGKENTHIDRFFPAFKKNEAKAEYLGVLVTVPVEEYVASRPRPYIPETDGRITIEK
jgi:5'-nucleotidase/UDP-sugar diphosphatase